MAANFCPQCGTPRGDGRFCANCGHEIGDATVPALSPPPVSQPNINDVYVAPRVRSPLPDFVSRQLHPDEHLLGVFSASLFDHRHKKKWGHDKFALTTERVMFFQNNWVHKEMDQMPYRSITGVQYNKGLRHGKVVVEAAHIGLTMDGISNDDAAFAERLISGSIGGRRFLPEPGSARSGSSPWSAVGKAGLVVGKAGATAMKTAAEQVSAYRERQNQETDETTGAPTSSPGQDGTTSYWETRGKSPKPPSEGG